MMSVLWLLGLVWVLGGHFGLWSVAIVDAMDWMRAMLPSSAILLIPVRFVGMSRRSFTLS